MQGYRLESRGMSIPREITHLKKLNSISRSLQLVNKDTNVTVAQSHSRIRRSIFRKPRDMNLEISQAVSNEVDLVLLTFILVWRERQGERSKTLDMVYQIHAELPESLANID